MWWRGGNFLLLAGGEPRSLSRQIFYLCMRVFIYLFISNQTQYNLKANVVIIQNTLRYCVLQ